MKSIIPGLRGVFLAAALLLVACGTISAMVEEEEYEEQQQQKVEGVLHEVAIMAKVLETRLKDVLEEDVVTGGIFQRGGVRGFHVPGVGVVFQFNVNFPVAERKAPEKPDAPKKNDLWSRIERGEDVSKGRSGPFIGYGSGFPGEGYDGHFPGGGGLGSGFPGESASDPFGNVYGFMGTDAGLSKNERRKIENMEEVVLEVLAAYGERMTSVEPTEQIIVLVGGAPQGSPFWRLLYTGGASADSEFLLFNTVGGRKVKDAEKARELRKQLDSVEKSLLDLEEQLKKHPDGKLAVKQKAMRDLLATQKAQLRQQEELLRDIAAQRTSGTDAGKSPFLVSGHRAAPSTSWVLTVRKGDLVEDPGKLRRAATLEKY